MGHLHELVGGFAHRRDDDDEFVSRFFSADDTVGDVFDAFDITDGGSAVFLYNYGHISL